MNANPQGGYVAESTGLCGQCRNRIEKGQKFRWRSSSPAVPVHVNCDQAAKDKEAAGRAKEDAPR